MPVSLLDQLCRGQYVFLHANPVEIRRILPALDEVLPRPQEIFQENEAAAPLVGYPVFMGRTLQRLDGLLGAYLESEVEAQVAYKTRGSFDSKAYAKCWESYRVLLDSVLENATVSSIGRDYVGVFWLYHSLAVARLVQEIPRRLRRDHAAVAREHGDDLTYKVFFKWADRVSTLSHDIAQRLAEEMDVGVTDLYPPLLDLMKDNVLIFTEDYVSPDLTELSAYFAGCLHVDARDLKQRVKTLDEWHEKLLRSDQVVHAAASELAQADMAGEAHKILYRPGWITYLSKHPRWNRRTLPSDEQIQLWEGLLQKIKEFELLHTLRKMIVPIEREEDGKLVSRDRSINTTWLGGPPVLELSSVNRPIDFSKPWVVNPVVQRYGLVYDITDFSATISILGRAEKAALEEAFRMSAQFERKINRRAVALDLKLEKYLGDGAFYSGRQARQLLALAIHIQRLYPQFVDRGFPFDRGLRIAMNFGEYRLLPLESESRLEEPRYEYFGHGLVELSRLTTGKKTQEIDTFKTYLVSQGYSNTLVNQFFAPMMQRNQELVSKIDEERRFYAYLNQTSTLINEGIVATKSFVEHLGRFDAMYYGRYHGRGFIAVHVQDDDQELLVGFRKLGKGRFKGLEPLTVFEVVDAGDWDRSALKEIPCQPLLGHLERLFTKTVTAAGQSNGFASEPPHEAP